MNDRWRDEEERRREWRERQDEIERRRAGYGESSYSPPRERYGQGQGREGRDPTYDRGPGEYGRYGQGHGPGGYGQGAPYGWQPREHYAEGGYEDHSYARRYERERERERERGWDRPRDVQGAPRDPYREEERSWWDRSRDEAGALFGDEEAERRRREEHRRRGHPYESRYDPRRDDTGWNDPMTDERRMERRYERGAFGPGGWRGPDRRR